ncbi:hypothetical protein [Metabacillus fastidiosus]|uniref:hypothetical protein n=1 Tax=Metabacillus fastidiosus TaxID=1458 RepID=UPI002E1C94BF|nr:hypothetical protein [Metabacillus fastidiosus]
MDIEVKYALFKNVQGQSSVHLGDRYEVITISDDLDMDTQEGNEEIKAEISRVTGYSKTDIKVLSGSEV